MSFVQLVPWTVYDWLIEPIADPASDNSATAWSRSLTIPVMIPSVKMVVTSNSSAVTTKPPFFLVFFFVATS